MAAAALLLLFLSNRDICKYYKENFNVFKIFFFLFFQLVALKRFLKLINVQTNPAIKLVLEKLGKLYGLWSIEKHLAIFYAGMFFYAFILQ